MEKIRFESGKEYNLITCGLTADEGKMNIKLIPGEDTLDTINLLVSNAEATGEIKLISEAGETLGIYSGYTSLQSLLLTVDAIIGYSQDEEQEPIIGKLVTVVLMKPDTTEQRLSALEDTVDTLVMESLGL